MGIGSLDWGGFKVHKNRLVFRFIGWFFLANAVVFWCLGTGYLSAIFYSDSLYLNQLSKFYTFGSKAWIVAFSVVNYLAYLMFLAFIPAVIVILLASLWPNKRAIAGISIFLSGVSALALIADSRVFAMFKFHITPTLVSMACGPGWRDLFDFSNVEVFVIVGVVILVFVLEVFFAWVVWHHIILKERFKVGGRIALFWVASVWFSYITLIETVQIEVKSFANQVAILPFYSQLVQRIVPMNTILRRNSEETFAQLRFPNDRNLNYPRHPMRCSAPDKPYNIIFIMVDALRADSLVSQFMPNTAQFVKKGWQFTNHMSGGNVTQAGVFSLFYSIPSSYWTSALEQKKTPVLVDLLQKYHYETQIIWSMEMYMPAFNKTIYANVKDLPVNGAPGVDVGGWDRDTTNKAIQFLNSSHHKRPFYLHLFYDAPHGYCSYQSYAEPYQPTSKHCSRIHWSNARDPLLYYNRYLNALHFVDEEIGKVLAVIQEKGYLENSIVILTSDHGQEFDDNKHNYWEHGSNFTKTQVQVPLAIYWPGEKPRTIRYATSGYDLVPTLLTRLFACQNPISDYSIGQNLLQDFGRLPFVLAGSYVNMGIIEPDRLTTLEASGIVRITDPTALEMPNAKPRLDILHNALVLMRKYYTSSS